MPSSYVSFHCLDETERQVAGRCRKQNSVPCCWLQSFYASQRLCTGEADSRLWEVIVYQKIMSRQVGMNQHWHFKGIFKTYLSMSIGGKEYQEWIRHNEMWKWASLGKAACQHLRNCYVYNPGGFECALYKECVRNSPFALFPLQFDGAIGQFLDKDFMWSYDKTRPCLQRLHKGIKTREISLQGNNPTHTKKVEATEESWKRRGGLLQEDHTSAKWCSENTSTGSII